MDLLARAFPETVPSNGVLWRLRRKEEMTQQVSGMSLLGDRLSATVLLFEKYRASFAKLLDNSIGGCLSGSSTLTTRKSPFFEELNYFYIRKDSVKKGEIASNNPSNSYLWVIHCQLTRWH